MPHAKFTHLHLHTEYSLLDGAIRIKDLFKRAKQHKLASLAMTDHGAMYGVVEFYKEAEKSGIKPILGCEVYVAPGDMRERKIGPHGVGNYHLILLSRNEVGYRNLCRLVSAAHQNGFYYKPRIDKEILAAHSEGLIGLSACLAGEVPRAIMRGDMDAAREAATQYSSILGEGNYYLELQNNGIEQQTTVNEGLVELSKELSLPLVATNDCHYLDQADAKSHEVLVCVQTGRTMSDDSRMKMQTDAFYLRSPEEMTELFSWCPEAIENTVEIAGRCNVELDFKTYHFPDYDGVEEDESLDDCLDRLAHEGLEQRIAKMSFDSEETKKSTVEQYDNRLRIELGVIREMGFPGYFLIVQDFINWAKNHDVPVGPGRGSAAGSLVAYSLKITDIDPIPYDLLFERFLNPERISMPDIDVDFCFENRDKVIEYVTEHYGRDKVAQITTFGKMLARAVIRDVGRVLDIPYGDVDKLAKLVPTRLGIKLKEAIDEEVQIREMMDADPRIKELITHALRLEGLNRHASTHAAGVVIANKPLVDYLPVYTGKEGETVTQFAMKAVEAIGLIKFDFLGLKTLTVIHKAVEMINRGRPADDQLDIEKLPLDDAKSYELLSNAETTGVFQLESSGMKELMANMRPSTFEDIIALVALYRPGPLGSGMVDDFIRRKHGQNPISYELPQLEPILHDTYGVIVYQEQVMKIAQVLANYSLGEADLLRRAMGKKIASEMEEQRERFMQGTKENSIPEGKAVKIFELMMKFAEYGFNKSHSAAYALVAYQTAYLKAHYPVEFMASLLTNDRSHSDKIVKNLVECKEMSIEVQPPDVNESDLFFTVAGEKIRFGLAAVKNVGEAALETVIAAREEGGPFAGLFDFCDRVDLKKVNRKVIESLVRCGAFDSLGGKRSQYLAVLELALEVGAKRRKERNSTQQNFFDALTPAATEEEGALADELPNLPEIPDTEKLHVEKELLGFYLSGHPLSQWSELLGANTSASLSAISELPDKSTVSVGGSVAAKREITTKSGKRMAFVTLEDMEGTIEVVIFPGLFAEAMELFNSPVPLIVRGTLEKGEDACKVLADQIVMITEASETLTETVRIRINAGMHSEADIDSLKAVLSKPEHSGNCAAYVDVIIPGKARVSMRLPSTMSLQPSDDLKNELRGLFGADVVTYH